MSQKILIVTDDKFRARIQLWDLDAELIREASREEASRLVREEHWDRIYIDDGRSWDVQLSEMTAEDGVRITAENRARLLEKSPQS